MTEIDYDFAPSMKALALTNCAASAGASNMKIVAAISGLVVMVVTAHSLGLLLAIVAGAVVGGVVGVLLSIWSDGSGAPKSDRQQTVLPEAQSEEAILAETRTRLDKVRKISVAEEQFEYLAKIVAGVEAGDPQPHWTLGEAYLHGRLAITNPFPQDKQAALFWFRRSAELGLASSQYHLGLMYLGEIAWELRIEYSPDDLIEKNPDEAVRWLAKAADQSDTFAAFAQDVLGEMYFSGLVVKQDHAEAFALFSKAAANPKNLMARYGLATRASERLPTLKAEGHG